MVQVEKQHYYEGYDSEYRFITYWHQIEPILKNKSIKSVIEVGTGNGFVADYLKKLNYDVKTVDFAADLNPDYILNIVWDELPIADCTICCEVLEHLEWYNVSFALENIRSKHAIISVPQYCIQFNLGLRFNAILARFFKVLSFNLPYFFTKPKFSGEHHWGLGQWGTSKRKFEKKIRDADWEIVERFSPRMYQDIVYYVLIRK